MIIEPADDVPLRDAFETEIEFSSWLAAHPQLLESALGVEIDRESIRVEQRVGPFRADMYASATTPESDELQPLVVECQLEATDHKHLGQLLTYAVGLGAPIAAWVVANAQPEHSRVVNWLNDHSPLQAWLLELETVRVRDDLGVALLRPIAQPTSTSAAQGTPPDDSERAQQRRSWWSHVLETAPEVLGPGHPWSSRSPTNTPTLKVNAPHGAYWHLTVGQHASRCYLRVPAAGDLSSEQVLNRLRGACLGLEAAFDQPLFWNPAPGAGTSTVGLETPVEAGYADERRWNEAVPALLSNARKLFQLLGPKWQEIDLSPDTDE